MLNIFNRANPTPSQDDGTIGSNGSYKSILRGRKAAKSQQHAVRWSETFETLDYDTDHGASNDSNSDISDEGREGTFETRDDGDTDLIADFNWVYNGESMYTMDTYSSRSNSEENTYMDTVSVSESVDGDVEVEAIPNERGRPRYRSENHERREGVEEERAEFRNLACASTVSEATLVKDKYGLDGVESKDDEMLPVVDVVQTGGKVRVASPVHAEVAKNGAVDKVIPSDGINTFTPQKELPPITVEFPFDAVTSTDSNTMGTLSADELTLNNNSFTDNHSWIGDRQACSDDGSIITLTKKDHSYEHIFENQHKADVSHGHIGLILPFLDRFKCGAFTENESFVKTWDAKALKNELLVKKGTRDNGSSEERDASKSNGSIAKSEGTTETSKPATRSIDEFDIKLDNIGLSQGDEEHAMSVGSGAKSVGSGSRQSKADASEKSGSVQESAASGSRASSRSLAAWPERIGHVISIHSVDDGSIPSRESTDMVGGRKVKTFGKKKKAFMKPFASFGNRIARAASSIVGKSRKNKRKAAQANHCSPVSPRSGSLHDRVYNYNIPAVESCVSTGTILGELQIIEDTAMAMYHDRFNYITTFFNPEENVTQAEVREEQEQEQEEVGDVSTRQHKKRFGFFDKVASMFTSTFSCDDHNVAGQEY